MRMRPSIYVVFCFFALSFSEGHAASPELTLLYTANSNGKLMYCNCPDDPYGGLSERVTLIRKMRKREGGFLLLDAGNMVGLFGDYELKASCVFRIMNLMGYDVAAAGRNEVYRGIPRILEPVKKAAFPVVSVTIADRESGELLFEPYAAKRIGGVTVAVTAVCDSTSFMDTAKKEYDFTLLPVRESLGSVLDEMSRGSDFVVVLSQLSRESNAALLKTFPLIDLIVQGFGNAKYDEPVVLPEGIIVSPGIYGEFVGLMTLVKIGGKATVVRSELIPVLGYPADEKAEKIVVEYYRNRK